jgi:hypothetical protein
MSPRGHVWGEFARPLAPAADLRIVALAMLRPTNGMVVHADDPMTPSSASASLAAACSPLFDRRLPATVGVVLLAALLADVYAALELRGVFADGSLWLVQMIVEIGFWPAEQARFVATAAAEVPTVLALKLGETDLYRLTVLWGLGQSLLPLALIAASYPALPRDRRALFVFPLFFYLAGAEATAFASVVVGAAVTAYFWLLLIVITFRVHRPWSWILLAAAAAPAYGAHEIMAFLAPLLTLTSVLRAWRTRASWARFGFLLLAGWFVVVTAREFGLVIVPEHPIQRASIIQSMVHLQFIGTSRELNPPAILGLLALVALPGTLSLHVGRIRFPAWLRSWTVLGFGALCLISAAGPLITDFLFEPTLQFAARYYGALLSLPVERQL